MCTLCNTEPLQLVVMNVEVFHLGPYSDVLRQLFQPIIGRFEAAGISNELLVLEDLLGQFLHQDRVERHVESFDVLLPADHSLCDVSAQLRRQCDHLAAGAHRRDWLLVPPTTHFPPLSFTQPPVGLYRASCSTASDQQNGVTKISTSIGSVDFSVFEVF